MKTSKQLRIGIKVESEHGDLVSYLKRYLKTKKKWPTKREIYKRIAKAHIREDPKYYTKLMKAKL